MSEIADRLSALRQRVERACAVAGRSPGEVQILAAVKTQSPERIVEALAAGVRLLGQNRAQELVLVQPLVHELWPGGFETHFIGALQTNKVNQVLRHVTCVQSVDRLALAERLSTAAAREGRTVEVFVEVNASGEASKAGVPPREAVAFAGEVAALPGLRLRGLMTVGANSPDPGLVRAGFEEMARLSTELVAAPATAGARELSMGMSADLDIAIAAGSTMVRVGTALFGPRTTPRPAT